MRYVYDKNTDTLIPVGGHEIVDASGTTMTQRSKLQFMNATIQDDSTNDKIIITPTGGGSGGNISQVEEMIAPIETNSSASSRDYIVGDHLILSDVLYRVIDDIDVGDPLTVGTNIEVSNISKDKAQIELLAYHDDGDTTNQRYNKGDFVIHLGILFKLTQDIPQGGAIVENTNAKVITSIGKAINDVRDQVGAAVNRLGAKNLFKSTATSPGSAVDGITFTVYTDKSVGALGTATADASLVIGTFSCEATQSYKFVGCPSGGSASTYALKLTFAGGPGPAFDAYDYGEGYTYTPAYNFTVTLTIEIYNGTACNPAKMFYPMIIPPEIEDLTYVPYVPTNAEISSEIQALTNQVDSIIQESVFTIEEEDGVLYLDWHGAAGECPYSTQLIGTNYELIFTYETT